MGQMYNQEYMRAPQALTAAGSTVMARVLGLLGFSFAFTAVGALVGIQLGPGGYLVGLVAGVITLVALLVLKERTPLNLVLLYAFATAEGLLLGGILEQYVRAGLGGAIVDAAGTTAVVTLAASAYGVTTKRDLTKLAGVLTIGLFALLAALLVGLFVHLAAFQLAVAAIGALLFTGFITLDMQRVARTHAAGEGDAILMAVSIYLDIVNLFLFLLQIFGLEQGNRD
jgi:modulator of FtsH protease